MSLLKKLKSILGLSDSSTTPDSERVGVTVERDPEADAERSSSPTVASETETGAAPVGHASDTVESPTQVGEESSPIGDSDTVDEPDASVTTEATETTETAGASETTTTTEATPSEGSSEPTTEISGIGPSYSEALASAGVETIGQLADADAGELADRTDLGENRIAGWIEAARARNE